MKISDRTVDLAWGLVEGLEAGQIENCFKEMKMEIESRIEKYKKEIERLQEIYEYINKIV